MQRERAERRYAHADLLACTGAHIYRLRLHIAQQPSLCHVEAAAAVAAAAAAAAAAGICVHVCLFVSTACDCLLQPQEASS